MLLSQDYLAGVRDALDAIAQGGGADVLDALRRLKLTVDDIGATKAVRDLQLRRVESDRQREVFERSMSPDYQLRRQS